MSESLGRIATPEEAAEDVRALQARVQSAFLSAGVVCGDARQEALGMLRDGLREGRFGGIALSGDAPECLITLLDRLAWPLAPAQLAQSMPHFPLSYGLTELRETLARLGYESTSAQFTAGGVQDKHLPAVVVDPNGGIALVETVPGADARAIDPQTGAPRPIDWSEPLTVVSFRQASTVADTAGPRKSWFREMLRRFRREILVLLGVTFAINCMVLAVSFAVMAIYDKVIPAGALDTMLAIAIGIGVALVVELSFRRLKARMIGHVSGRLEYLLGTAIFRKLMSFPLEMVTSTPIGAQLARLRQFEVVRDMFAGPFATIGLEIPFIFMFAGALFIIGGPLGFAPLGLVVVYLLVGALLLPVVKRHNETANKLRSEQYQTLLEMVSNIRILRSNACDEVWLDRLEVKTDEMIAAKMRASFSKRVLTAISASAIPIAGGLMVVLGAMMVIAGNLTVGALVGSMILVWRVLAPIQQAFLTLSRYTEMIQMAGQIDSMMRIKVDEGIADGPVARRFSGAIAADRLSYRFPRATDPAIAGATLEIEPGELIAVTGSSGSGKSTFLKLLLGTLRPLAGSVSVDRINIRQLGPSERHATFAYVAQIPEFFHGTIAQNLRLSAPDASRESLRRVCAEIGILRAIESLPEGFDTLLDHARQESLPQGFRQALAVAQALLRRPKILLLDEPAKNLDPAIEQAFLQVIGRRRGGTTIIMVTHRPSHINIADKVLRIERGQVVDFSPPDGGMQKTG